MLDVLWEVIKYLAYCRWPLPCGGAAYLAFGRWAEQNISLQYISLCQYDTWRWVAQTLTQNCTFQTPKSTVISSQTGSRTCLQDNPIFPATAEVFGAMSLRLRAKGRWKLSLWATLAVSPFRKVDSCLWFSRLSRVLSSRNLVWKLQKVQKYQKSLQSVVELYLLYIIYLPCVEDSWSFEQPDFLQLRSDFAASLGCECLP